MRVSGKEGSLRWKDGWVDRWMTSRLGGAGGTEREAGRRVEMLGK